MKSWAFPMNHFGVLVMSVATIGCGGACWIDATTCCVCHVAKAVPHFPTRNAIHRSVSRVRMATGVNSLLAESNSKSKIRVAA
jgi:hypothetical protein